MSAGNFSRLREDLIARMATSNAALRSENNRLLRWKAEAIEVLAAWDEVHVALGSPGRPGQSIAEASAVEARRIRGQALSPDSPEDGNR